MKLEKGKAYIFSASCGIYEGIYQGAANYNTIWESLPFSMVCGCPRITPLGAITWAMEVPYHDKMLEREYSEKLREVLQ